MRSVFSAALLLFTLLSSGCAFQKQAIVLDPAVEVANSDTGGGMPVAISVSDERPRSTLGTRGVGGIGEQLTLAGDIAITVRDAVSDGLVRQDFTIAEALENQLRVEIRSLDYRVNSGFWAGTLNIEFLLKGICIKGHQRPYEQMYRGEFHKSVQVVQGKEANNMFVNQVVSQAINRLVNDATLIACLAR